MDIYNYHPSTREYHSKSKADLDPMEEGRFLIPANSTDIVPPDKKAGHALVFHAGKWVNKVDNRGEVYWSPDGQKVTINEIGVEVPSYALFEEPDLRTIDEIRSDAIVLVHAKHAEFLRSLTGNATIEERDTWQAKALAAEAILAGTASAIQQEMIATEASVVGETEEQLIQMVVGKSNAYHKLIGLASGLRRKTEAALFVASSKEEVDQILTTSDQQAKQFVQQWQSDP